MATDLMSVKNTLPAFFDTTNDDLSAGVSGGFSVISYRGAKWRIKHAGEETLLLNAEGEPQPSIRVIMLKANKNLSKNYFEGGFVEGSSDSPTCWSTDGVKPDAGVESPINPVCSSCPNNAFGSRVTDTGSKAKACSDTRRIAVVPENDPENKLFGGPMLLRVPAASLSELASYGKAMAAKSHPYNTIVTKIGFDPDVAYPKLKFQAARPITAEERGTLSELLADPDYRQKIEFILAQAIEHAVAAEPAPVVAKKVESTDFEDEAVPEVTAKPKAPVGRPRAVKAVEPVAAAPKTPPAAPKVDLSTEMDDELESILAKLDSLD